MLIMGTSKNTLNSEINPLAASQMPNSGYLPEEI
jgi:hypothetical protein